MLVDLHAPLNALDTILTRSFLYFLWVIRFPSTVTHGM